MLKMVLTQSYKQRMVASFLDLEAGVNGSEEDKESGMDNEDSKTY
jgi:hypothetical protein